MSSPTLSAQKDISDIKHIAEIATNFLLAFFIFLLLWLAKVTKDPST
jgi:hypothetical protein